MRIFAIAAAAIFLAVLTYERSEGASQKKRIGSWEVSVERDRFDETTQASAIMFYNATGLAVRCLAGELTFAIAIPYGGDFQLNDTFSVVVRIDQKPIRTTDGIALSRDVIQIVLWRVILEDALSGREIAFRITNSQGIKVDYIFPLGRARDALPPVASACGFQ